MNIKFDSKVQQTKCQVLTEVAKRAWGDNFFETILDIPAIISPGPNPTVRCCIYKERAIVNERVKIALGGNRNNPNIIEVIELACDECPEGGYVVTDICRGCLSHKCEANCMRKAITFDEKGKANIDKTKCVECGMCAKNCPYSAIYNRKRPCENACKIKAISRGENGAAKIDNNVCVSCGSCSAQCPFGAIMDKSYILNVIDYIIKSEDSTKFNVHAIVAPAIASQFAPVKFKQLVAGLKQLGFTDVYEAALGADSVALKESLELAERDGEPMTSSCCPAFVKYIKTAYPQLADKISSNLSPGAEIGKFLKERDPKSKVVFIGPCTAKKMEFQQSPQKDYVDAVMTFEELYALFEAKAVDPIKLKEEEPSGASYFGRIFARSGGLSEAVVQALKEQGLAFEAKAVVCQGLDQCKMALNKLALGKLDGNFIEGMACPLGCVGGAGNITRNERNFMKVDALAKERVESITDSVKTNLK